MQENISYSEVSEQIDALAAIRLKLPEEGKSGLPFWAAINAQTAVLTERLSKRDTLDRYCYDGGSPWVIMVAYSAAAWLAGDPGALLPTVWWVLEKK